MEHFREPLKSDCEELLVRFQAAESVRYEQFLVIWKEMGFSTIFFGKQEPAEKRNFARLVLSVVSPYLFPPYTFQIRVGALYLLYGLFNTQLTTPKEKVRIALKVWKDVLQFERDAINAQHYDVVYVFRKLLSDKAFHFTAMPTQLFFRSKREDGRRKTVCEEFVDPSSRPQQLITTDMLEEITNVHAHYEGLKKAVFTEPDPDMDLIQQNLVPKLNSTVYTYSAWQRNRAQSEEQDPGEGPSNQESSSRAQLLASIKSKSYGQVVEASKSRRHRQTELIPATIADLSSNVPFKYKRNPSLKTRTQLLYNIQVGNKKEDMTRMWCLSSVKEGKAAEKRPRRFNWNPDRSSDLT